MKVVAVLESLPGVGKVKARRIMEEIGISRDPPGPGLGAQQRQVAAQLSQQLHRADRPSIIVISGPGGVGKGTVVARARRARPRPLAEPLVDHPARRPGEAADAYIFVDRGAFEARIAEGGFLEWAEFLGQLLRHPDPDGCRPAPTWCSRSRSTGPSRSRRRHPEALLIFVAAARRRGAGAAPAGRGDPADKVARAAAQGRATRSRSGKALADHVVVNDDLEQTVDELLAIIDGARAERRPLGLTGAGAALIGRCRRRGSGRYA